jgi:uncharacterized protein YaeQ
MARPSTIYRANLQISDIDHGVYETVATTVAQHPSETEERLVARLLAFAIFHESELTFTKGLSSTDEPDLWVIGPDGRVQFWIEVGVPDGDRIIKASRHAERVALLASGKTLFNWDQQHFPKLEKIDNLTIVSVDQSLISSLASQLERTINWSITITEGTLYLTNGDVTHETAIEVKTGTL